MFDGDTGNGGAFSAPVVAALFVCLGTTPQAHAEDNESSLTTFTQLTEELLDDDTDHFFVTGRLEIEGPVSAAHGVLCPQVPATSEAAPEYVFNEESETGCKLEGSPSDRVWEIGSTTIAPEIPVPIWSFSPLVSVEDFRPKNPSSDTYSGIRSMKIGWAMVEHLVKHPGEDLFNSMDELRSTSKSFRTRSQGDPIDIEFVLKLKKRGSATRHEDEQHFDATKMKVASSLGDQGKPIETALNIIEGVEVEVLHDKKPDFLTQVVPAKEAKWLIANVEFAGCFRENEFSAEVCSIQFGSGDQWALASVIDGDDPVAAFRARASAFSNGVDSARLENLQNGNSFGMAASESGSGVFDEQFSGGFHFRLDTDQGDESAFSDLSAEAGIFEVDTWDNGEGYAEFSAEAEVVTLAMADNADPFLSQMFDTPLDEGVLLTLRWPLDEDGDPLNFDSGSLPPDDHTVELVMMAVPEPGTGLLVVSVLYALAALRRRG
ncbi:MAG: hypothetical protein VYE73_13115 [Acidobacteriota bacterium]|nr:hypothetical protein [Acidobacteriota bacterium]